MSNTEMMVESPTNELEAADSAPPLPEISTPRNSQQDDGHELSANFLDLGISPVGAKIRHTYGLVSAVGATDKMAGYPDDEDADTMEDAICVDIDSDIEELPE